MYQLLPLAHIILLRNIYIVLAFRVYKGLHMYLLEDVLTKILYGKYYPHIGTGELKVDRSGLPLPTLCVPSRGEIWTADIPICCLVSSLSLCIGFHTIVKRDGHV